MTLNQTLAHEICRVRIYARKDESDFADSYIDTNIPSPGRACALVRDSAPWLNNGPLISAEASEHTQASKLQTIPDWRDQSIN